jgi:hypothetical protein
MFFTPVQPVSRGDLIVSSFRTLNDHCAVGLDNQFGTSSKALIYFGTIAFSI